MGRLMLSRGISIRYPEGVGAEFGGTTTPATFAATGSGDGSGVAVAVGSAVAAGDGELSGVVTAIGGAELGEFVAAGLSDGLEHPARRVTRTAAARRPRAERAWLPDAEEFTSAFYAKLWCLGKRAR